LSAANGSPTAAPDEHDAPAALELTQLRKLYGSEVAVESLTLNIRAGEFLTLLGPSGSGKSTTLMMIAGFVEPTSGELRIHGRQMNRVPPEARDVGMVFQNYALFPHMTVAANLGFPLRMRKMPKPQIQLRVVEMLQRLGLDKVGMRLPRQLSGGQQQRVALGRALIFGPKLLLMDEPLGALDRALREDLQQEIKRIVTESGATTVYVTHDQAEALNLSDRIAVFKAGRVEQVDTPLRLYREPTSTFVATFLGRATVCDANIRGIDAGEVRIEIPAAGGLAVGARRRDGGPGPQPREQWSVVIRPEDVRLRPAPDGSGQIESEVFFGEIVKRKVRVGTVLFSVDDPTLREPLGVGTCVHVSVNDAWCVERIA
jgi:ABC-type Fe3+/spermidine/putrescine transport system ATPase subunit